MLRGKRSDVAITMEILRLVRRGERKTRIMYGANLSYGMLTRYMDFLLDRGFIEEDPANHAYRITKRGNALAQDIERLRRHFDDDEGPFTSPFTKPGLHH